MQISIKSESLFIFQLPCGFDSFNRQILCDNGLILLKILHSHCNNWIHCTEGFYSCSFNLRKILFFYRKKSFWLSRKIPILRLSIVFFHKLWFMITLFSTCKFSKGVKLMNILSEYSEYSEYQQNPGDIHKFTPFSI